MKLSEITAACPLGRVGFWERAPSHLIELGEELVLWDDPRDLYIHGECGKFLSCVGGP